MTEDLVSVLLTQSWVEAEIIKGRLEAEGIPVHLEGVGEGPYPTGPSELFVPSTFEAHARRFLDEIGSGRTRFRTQTKVTPESPQPATRTPRAIRRKIRSQVSNLARRGGSCAA